MLLVSCGFLKKKGDDADADVDAAVVVAEVDAAPVPAAGPAAANEADIARFPDETKLDNVAASIKRFTNVREQPVAGKVVASLNPGATVTEIAQRPNLFLIVFADPKDASKKLMGWVTADAFVPAAVVDAGKPIVCAAPEVLLQSDIQFCGRTCGTDAQCPAGEACKGSAKVVVKGKPADVATTVCVASQAPVAAADAGGGGGNVAIRVDAGAPPAPFVPPGDVFPPPAGGCPADFVLASGQCHKRCRGAGKGNCAKAPFCIKCSGISVCANSLTECK
jgi:hypothetical protein